MDIFRDYLLTNSILFWLQRKDRGLTMVMIPSTLKVSGSRASTHSSTSTTAPSSSSSTSTEVSGWEDDPENLFLKETLESFFLFILKWIVIVVRYMDIMQQLLL